MTFKPTITTVSIFNEEILYEGLVKTYWKQSMEGVGPFNLRLTGGGGGSCNFQLPMGVGHAVFSNRIGTHLIQSTTEGSPSVPKEENCSGRG